MDFHQVMPRLFIGTYPSSAEEIRDLRRLTGVSCILSLQTDEDLERLGIAWDALLRAYGSQGIEVRRLPVRDFDTADLQEKLPECVAALRQLLDAGHVVYLHCTAGAGRSPTVAMGYLVDCGWDLAAAEAHIRQCRPCWPNLEALRGALGI